jgi:hypothetical protein
MRYKRTVARIGVQFPRWFWVDRKVSVMTARWRTVLDPNIDQGTGRTGAWTEDEDSKLKDAVQTNGGCNRDAIAVLARVPPPAPLPALVPALPRARLPALRRVARRVRIRRHRHRHRHRPVAGSPSSTPSSSPSPSLSPTVEGEKASSEAPSSSSS